jgi:Mycobacterium membrane protein
VQTVGKLHGDAEGCTSGGPPRHSAPRPTPAPRTRKRRTWPWVVGVVVLLLIGAGSLLGGGSSIPPTPTSLPPGSNPGVPARSAQQAAGSVVVYEIVGRGSASTITYTKQDFAQDQQATAQLPFRKELRFDEQVGGSGALSLTAQNSSRGGAITCRITVDGKVVNESTSTGQYTVVTCRGTG